MSSRLGRLTSNRHRQRIVRGRSLTLRLTEMMLEAARSPSRRSQSPPLPATSLLASPLNGYLPLPLLLRLLTPATTTTLLLLVIRPIVRGTDLARIPPVDPTHVDPVGLAPDQRLDRPESTREVSISECMKIWVDCHLPKWCTPRPKRRKRLCELTGRRKSTHSLLILHLRISKMLLSSMSTRTPLCLIRCRVGVLLGCLAGAICSVALPRIDLPSIRDRSPSRS